MVNLDDLYASDMMEFIYADVCIIITVTDETEGNQIYIKHKGMKCVTGSVNGRPTGR